MALLTTGHSLGMFAGPILAGIVADAFQLSLAFMGGTVVMVIGVAVTLILTSRFSTWEEA
jgi:hypothetical protein